MTCFVWITLNLDHILIAFVIISIVYVASWISIINTLGIKGWLLFICWVLIHALIIRFIYSWNRNNFDLTSTVLLISLVTTLSLHFIKPEWISFSALRTICLSVSLLFAVFLFALERNAALFLKYKMLTTGKFEYPPYSTFKKEINWKTFFAQHTSRKWICSSLTYFFENHATYDRFTDALFNAWGHYNKTHADKIEFDRNGIFLGEQWNKSATILCSDECFLTSWIKKANSSKEMELSLINFLKNLNKNIVDFQDELSYETELKQELLTSLKIGESQVTQAQFPKLSEALNDLTFTLRQDK